jgi:hypothetical protein
VVKQRQARPQTNAKSADPHASRRTHPQRISKKAIPKKRSIFSNSKNKMNHAHKTKNTEALLSYMEIPRAQRTMVPSTTFGQLFYHLTTSLQEVEK